MSVSERLSAMSCTGSSNPGSGTSGTPDITGVSSFKGASGQALSHGRAKPMLRLGSHTRHYSDGMSLLERARRAAPGALSRQHPVRRADQTSRLTRCRAWRPRARRGVACRRMRVVPYLLTAVMFGMRVCGQRFTSRARCADHRRLPSFCCCPPDRELAALVVSANQPFTCSMQ